MADYGIIGGVAHYWVNREGRTAISDMDTSHIVNTIAFVEKRMEVLEDFSFPDIEDEAQAVLMGLRGELVRREQEPRQVPWRVPQTQWERLLDDDA